MKLNIVFTINENYAKHCATLIQSILLNKSFSYNIDFHIISNDLTTFSKSSLHNLVKRDSSVSLIFYDYDTEKIQNIFSLNKASYLAHISSDTFVRLFLTEIIPPSIDVVLYLDVDIIVNGDIINLFVENNIDDYLVGAVPQIDENFITNNQRVYNSDYLYFNAGVLLLNLKNLRKINCVTLYKEFYKENSELVLYNDQDILNFCIGHRVKYLDLKYNVITPFLRKSSKGLIDYSYQYGKINQSIYFAMEKHDEALLNPVVIHFVSRPKPWEFGCSHPFRRLYFESLHLTNFKSKHRIIFNFSSNIFAELKMIYNSFFRMKNKFLVR